MILRGVISKAIYSDNHKRLKFVDRTDMCNRSYLIQTKLLCNYQQDLVSNHKVKFPQYLLDSNQQLISWIGENVMGNWCALLEIGCVTSFVWFCLEHEGEAMMLRLAFETS